MTALGLSLPVADVKKKTDPGPPSTSKPISLNGGGGGEFVTDKTTSQPIF